MNNFYTCLPPSLKEDPDSLPEILKMKFKNT